MDREQIEQYYRNKGLDTEYRLDQPGQAHGPHIHEQMYLYTMSGSASIKIENQEWQTLQPGQEIMVDTNQLHETKVGMQGWEYITAWDPEELAA